MQVVVGSCPLDFPGTDEEIAANGETHKFLWDDDGSRCMDCDSRYGSISAQWPCGAVVPRGDITIEQKEDS